MNTTPEQLPQDETVGLPERLRYVRYALLAAAVIALAYLFYAAGPEKIAATASTLNPFWVAAAMLFWIFNLMFAALRLKYLAAPELKYARVLRVVMAGYLLNFASMVQGLGIGAKLGIMKGYRVPVSRSLAGIGGELILDIFLYGVVTAVFAGYVGISRSGMDRVSPYVFITVGVFALSGMVLLPLIASRFDFGVRLLESLRIAFSTGRLPVNILSSIGILLMAAASLYCIMRAVGVTVSPLFTASAISVGFITGLVSLVPGGIGVRDLTWAYVVTSMTGASMTVTATAAFAQRIFAIPLVAALLGIWVLAEKRFD